MKTGKKYEEKKSDFSFLPGREILSGYVFGGFWGRRSDLMNSNLKDFFFVLFQTQCSTAASHTLHQFNHSVYFSAAATKHVFQSTAHTPLIYCTF